MEFVAFRKEQGAILTPQFNAKSVVKSTHQIKLILMELGLGVTHCFTRYLVISVRILF